MGNFDRLWDSKVSVYEQWSKEHVRSKTIDFYWYSMMLVLSCGLAVELKVHLHGARIFETKPLECVL